MKLHISSRNVTGSINTYERAVTLEKEYAYKL